MNHVEKSAFISYRRTNAFVALAVYQNLTQHGYDTFLDYKGIGSGDFERVIIENIQNRAHFILILTPSALERCEDSGDWLRREIETALDARRNIVPLMFESFDFRSREIADRLTGKLAILKNYNALRVPAEYFDDAMKKLRENYLNLSLTTVLHPSSASARSAALKSQKQANLAAPVQASELSAELWFERGYCSRESHEQLQCYGEAIRLSPTHVDAYYCRGTVLLELGHLEDARRDFDRVIQLSPTYAEAYNNRGNVRSATGDLDGAIRDYTQSIELRNPLLHLPYTCRGNARAAKGDSSGALRDHSEAIRLKPDDAVAYVNRGHLLSSLGNLDGALRDFDLAIQLNPYVADFYMKRGVTRNKTGDHEGAIEDHTEAIKLRHPNLHLAYTNRGAALRQNGDPDGALRDFDEAIRMRPDYASAYFNRALLREARSEYDLAIADLQKFLELGAGARHDNQAKIENILREIQAKRSFRRL